MWAGFATHHCSSAFRRHAENMTSFIWDRQSGKQIAWIENDHDVYSVVTKRKFATVRDGKLIS
jgi:hypothetical protein